MKPWLIFLGGVALGAALVGLGIQLHPATSAGGGRFKVEVHNGLMVRYDTKTGQTWMDGKDGWELMREPYPNP